MPPSKRGASSDCPSTVIHETRHLSSRPMSGST
jgi:hypothetical protein